MVCGLGDSDSIYLGKGDDLALAAAGDDRVDGGPGTDVIYTGIGDDEAHGGGAPQGTGEEVHVGPGYDVVYYSGVRPGNGGVTIDLRVVGPQETGAGGVDDLQGVEQLHGTGRGDVLRGDAEDNNLRGGAGGDTIIGRGGNDRCSGSAGTDTFRTCEEIGDRR